MELCLHFSEQCREAPGGWLLQTEHGLREQSSVLSCPRAALTHVYGHQEISALELSFKANKTKACGAASPAVGKHPAAGAGRAPTGLLPEVTLQAPEAQSQLREEAAHCLTSVGQLG